MGFLASIELNDKRQAGHLICCAAFASMGDFGICTLSMDTDLLSESDDLEDMIEGYLDALLPELQLSDLRESIIEYWVSPFAGMTRLLQDASVSGKLDEVLLAAFMRDLVAAIDALGGEARGVVPEVLLGLGRPVLH
jgi:hypothetical protein